VFLFYSFSDSPRVLSRQSAVADNPLGVADHSADCLDRSGVFRLEVTFALQIVRALSSGQFAPSPADSPRQPGGQSDRYANSCQGCSVLLLLFYYFCVCFEKSFLGLVVDP
jgi:hypothetical protein